MRTTICDNLHRRAQLNEVVIMRKGRGEKPVRDLDPREIKILEIYNNPVEWMLSRPPTEQLLIRRSVAARDFALFLKLLSQTIKDEAANRRQPVTAIQVNDALLFSGQGVFA